MYDYLSPAEGELSGSATGGHRRGGHRDRHARPAAPYVDATMYPEQHYRSSSVPRGRRRSGHEMPDFLYEY